MGSAAEAHSQEHYKMGMLRDVLLDRCPGAHGAVREQKVEVAEGIGFLGEDMDVVESSNLVVGSADGNACALLLLLLDDGGGGESDRRGIPFGLLQFDPCTSTIENQF